MNEFNKPLPESQPLFSKEEWEASLPYLTTEMTAYLRRYRTPVFIDHGEYGRPWGSGAFIELDGRKYILTNKHVACVRGSYKLGFRLDEQEDMPRVIGDHIEIGPPWDLALLPVKDEVWLGLKHRSALIQVDQLALAHTPCQGEIFAVAGFAGERTKFLFEQMNFESTTSLSCEVELDDHDEIDHRFHFGIVYRTNLATSVVGKQGLPKPTGLSGSTVWNTCFVEAKKKGSTWTPKLAKVAGVVWGWPSGQGALVATKAEHVRSFLLGAI
jgi:hypothetical protein